MSETSPTSERLRPDEAVRDLPRLRRLYGKGYWRKMKGNARIRLQNGRIRVAELHWYEAHGIGKKEFKRKKLPRLGPARPLPPGARSRCASANEGYEASLERNKIYAVLPDEDAEQDGDLRVIDESGGGLPVLRRGFESRPPRQSLTSLDLAGVSGH